MTGMAEFCNKKCEVDNYPDFEDYQDPLTVETYEVTTRDLILFSIRIAVCLIFLVCTFYVLISGLFLHKYIKNWKLCLVTCGALSAWLGLSVYSDHIDEYWAGGFVIHYQTRNSIFQWFLNLFHGLTLFLTLLLLGHLADFQKRGCWLFLVALTIIVPIIYSVVIILVDLYAKKRFAGRKWSAFVVLFRTGIYNVLNTLLLLSFLPRFCTSRLYGTYDEKRSSSVILISRWIFIFLLLHNLTDIAWGIIIALRFFLEDVINDTDFVLIQDIFDEVKFVLIVLAIPFSYAVSLAVRTCCSHDEDAKNLEMDKIDKIYEEVWNPEDRKDTLDFPVTSDSLYTIDSGVSGFNRDPNVRKKR
ncbi:SLC6A7 [Lepeophtheirus salmonis]|uniref:SLC6A7 n=1 Tax=Lepeophtheirus salmonis TaxID=72036 RepID=A0A7R8CS71_LEPSM|nr:SLC6A7 [Lepeophtheirus salmonis]CAF2876908.1 SLC6A7 [Lepeophtheirus salmonis]